MSVASSFSCKIGVSIAACGDFIRGKKARVVLIFFKLFSWSVRIVCIASKPFIFIKLSGCDIVFCIYRLLIGG